MNNSFLALAVRLLGTIALLGCSSVWALTCDVDNSGEINRIDIALIMAALNQPTSGPSDPRDADGNGTINILDARACALRCTRANCGLPPTNTAPVANADSYSTPENATLQVSAPGVLGNDTDAQGNPLTAALVSGPASGILALNANGGFTYIPVRDFTGVVTFSYRANDGALDSNVATVAIDVTPVNQAPVATADSYSTAENVPLIVAAPGVLANDTDLEGSPLSAALVSGPASGVLAFNVDGSFSYSPALNFVGSVTFQYKVNDGMLDSNTATVTIHVTPAPMCQPGSGPTIHGSGSVSGDEVWTAAMSPHVVVVNTSIRGRLTIEPCAEVLIGPGLTVSVTGQLIAEGTANENIRIGAQMPAAPFAQIRGVAGEMRFAYTTIESGGDPLNTIPAVAGMISLQGIDQTQPTQGLLSVDHALVRGSASNGIVLSDGAGFAADSTALSVTGSALAPVNMWSRAVGTLPAGDYTGNGLDEIILLANGGTEGVAESTTIHDRGVPYRVGIDVSAGDLRINPLPGVLTPATLTIEPGVALRFKRGGILHVALGTGDTAALGVLVAVGTAAKPIVFTSAAATPAAGDWLGIYYGQIPDPANRIDFARVEYAGGFSQVGGSACPGPLAPPFDAAIRIFGPPSSEFVTHTTIFASARHGIDRGWRADVTLDFLPTNDFQSVAACKQTFPSAATGACPPPSMVPCPQ